jgi:xanthine dehydrogenase YagS FAD-binding subunit
LHPFQYTQPQDTAASLDAVAADPQAVFYAGGTTLIDLMKLDVIAPTELVDINRLPLDEIDVQPDRVRIGANVRNSDLAHHPVIRQRYPALSEALLAGASGQLRNMASTAGNILQRTRCLYFRDVHSACNKRTPGSGCDALSGFNRDHAILGVSERCIATHPSDMCVALAILDAFIVTQRANGASRRIPFEDFHLLPGDTPDKETVLEHGELITHITLHDLPIARRSCYRKVRDRASYEFALASAAVALDLDGATIRSARIALGGIATKPWRSREAEAALNGNAANEKTFQAAAEAALRDAKPQKYNAFKVELAKRTLVYALVELTARL